MNEIECPCCCRAVRYADGQTEVICEACGEVIAIPESEYA